LFEGFDDKLLKVLETKFAKKESGKDIIYKERDYESVSTGSKIIDLCISPKAKGKVGFFIKGKISEVSGPESSGKSTLVYSCAANAVKAGWTVALIDAEGSYDPLYAKALGLEEGKRFKVFRPITGEDTDALVNALTGNGKGNMKTKVKIDALLFDSVAAIKPAAMLEMEDSTGTGATKASHARFWNNMVAKLHKISLREDMAVVLVNQIRDKISMDSIYQEKSLNVNDLAAGLNSDNSKITTGGRGIKFFASLRLLLEQGRRPKIKKRVRGLEVDSKDTLTYTKVTVIKNKVDIPFMRAVAAIQFGKGFVDALPMYDYLKDVVKVIEVSTSGVYRLSFDGETVEVKGVSNFQKKLFTEYKDLLEKAYVHYKHKEYMELYNLDDEAALEELIDTDDDEDEVIYLEEEETPKKSKGSTNAKTKSRRTRKK